MIGLTKDLVTSQAGGSAAVSTVIVGALLGVEDTQPVPGSMRPVTVLSIVSGRGRIS